MMSSSVGAGHLVGHHARARCRWRRTPPGSRGCRTGTAGPARRGSGGRSRRPCRRRRGRAGCRGSARHRHRRRPSRRRRWRGRGRRRAGARRARRGWRRSRSCTVAPKASAAAVAGVDARPSRAGSPRTSRRRRRSGAGRPMPMLRSVARARRRSRSSRSSSSRRRRVRPSSWACAGVERHGGPRRAPGRPCRRARRRRGCGRSRRRRRAPRRGRAAPTCRAGPLPATVVDDVRRRPARARCWRRSPAARPVSRVSSAWVSRLSTPRSSSTSRHAAAGSPSRERRGRARRPPTRGWASSEGMGRTVLHDTRLSSREVQQT